MNWNKGLPPAFETVLLYNEKDLYPVVGYRVPSYSGREIYFLVVAGPEDGDPPAHTTPEGWEPTYWSGLPPCPYLETPF